MTYTDIVTRVGAIQDQIASLRTAFAPPTQTSASTSSGAGAGAATASTAGGASDYATVPTSSSTGATSFQSALQTAMALPAGATSGAGAALPSRASTMLTSDQQAFASRLAGQTGLDPGVISAWLLAEESGGAASSRQSAHNNDWLNIGYTDSGTHGAADSIWSDPVTAADATAGWLKGQDTIPGYGTASSGVQAILRTAGQPPAAQISALQGSGWASSGYPSLNALYQQVAA